MPYFALFYDVVNDFESKRAAFRQEHLHYARQAHARGELFLAGALADPADKAMLVFHTDDRAVAESFARQDPYVVNGLVLRWEVRPWTVVIGSTESPGGTLQVA
jgi:uncharacterized protein